MDTELDFPLQDGSTKRSHLQSIAKQTGESMEELEVPPVQPAGLFIKGVFDKLSLTRDWNSGYPQQITQSDIYYWCKLHNVKLNEWHLHVVQNLDVVQINSLVTLIKERNG